MNRLLPFALALVAATMCFTACGGDSGSGASDEISVNSSDDEGLDAASSTSVTAGEAKESKKSSSSKGSTAKSSESAASSSSVIPGTDRGSSSSGAASSSSTFVYHMCESGDTLSFMDDLSCMVYFSCVDFEWNIDSTICAPKPKVYPNMDRQFENPYSTLSEFTDPRDGQKYTTLILHKYDLNGKLVEDDSIEVFAQNLNYGEMVDSSVHRLDDGKVEKYCELNDEWFCENGWGGRYTWSEAMGISSKYDSVLWKDTTGGNTRIHQGICPEGWHIMNGYEWENYAKGTGLDMASKANWTTDKTGANLLGMSVLFDMRDYELSWMLTNFFTPAEESATIAYSVHVNDVYVKMGAAQKSELNRFPVRCVKNY
ncbi:MAG: FISUMP domain-containing protein [Fibrobacter sp.]|nr:FISUMP domain-containing protein [Fibrobacter sp.]